MSERGISGQPGCVNNFRHNFLFGSVTCRRTSLALLTSTGRYMSTSHWYRRRVFHLCLSHDLRCRQYSYLVCLSAYVAVHIIADQWQDNTCQVFCPFQLGYLARLICAYEYYFRSFTVHVSHRITCGTTPLHIGPRGGKWAGLTPPPRIQDDLLSCVTITTSTQSSNSCPVLSLSIFVP
jgi:hypothetical protein